MKRAVVVTVDALIGLVYGRETPRPWLSANRVENGEMKRILRYTRLAQYESILDAAVYRGDTDPYHTLATAESEAFSENDVCESSTSDTCDYLWDLYKLLQVASPLRLFVARVRTMKKCRMLELCIARMVKMYGKDMREKDRVFSIVLPTARFDYPSIRCQGWVCGKKGKMAGLQAR